MKKKSCTTNVVNQKTLNNSQLWLGKLPPKTTRAQIIHAKDNSHPDNSQPRQFPLGQIPPRTYPGDSCSGGTCPSTDIRHIKKDIIRPFAPGFFSLNSSRIHIYSYFLIKPKFHLVPKKKLSGRPFLV